MDNISLLCISVSIDNISLPNLESTKNIFIVIQSLLITFYFIETQSLLIIFHFIVNQSLLMTFHFIVT